MRASLSPSEAARDPLILNKLNQSCPGLDAGVGAELYSAVGLPTSQVRYRRLYVNGGYYDYALDIEVPGEDMLKRTTPAGHRRDLRPRHPRGQRGRHAGVPRPPRHRPAR